jgi:hypothetical protein
VGLFFNLGHYTGRSSSWHSALYSGGTGFKSRQESLSPESGFSSFFSVPPGKCRLIILSFDVMYSPTMSLSKSVKNTAPVKN